MDLTKQNYFSISMKKIDKISVMLLINKKNRVPHLQTYTNPSKSVPNPSKFRPNPYQISPISSKSVEKEMQNPSKSDRIHLFVYKNYITQTWASWFLKFRKKWRSNILKWFLIYKPKMDQNQWNSWKFNYSSKPGRVESHLILRLFFFEPGDSYKKNSYKKTVLCKVFLLLGQSL